MGKYKLEIDSETLENLVIDYLADHFVMVSNLNKEHKADKKNTVDVDYYKRSYEENMEWMKTLAKTLEYFTAPDDPRRKTVKKSSF